MCVIIIKQKNNTMPLEVAKTSARINPHGLGIVWLDTFEVTYHKSSEYKQLITERPFIAHFRYATVGAVGRANTHPFVCGSNKDELLMMNGTIKGLGNPQMCDSKELAINLGKVDRKDWKKELEQYECRFVTINKRTRSFQIYNRNLYTYKDGIWYSKDNVLQSNLVAVYGTLKKGYSNYFGHLMSSKYLGKGETKDKYPLVINGLPYLGDKRGIGYNVDVDVFKVSDSTLKNLDILESHPRFYERKQIQIKMKKGSVLTCWVYFCDRGLTPHTELHKSYTQERRWNLDKSYIYDNVQDTVDEVDNTQLDFGWDDNDFPTEQTPYCVDCYADVEHDGFTNYYCSSCGGWFKEDEVLKFQD